MDKGNVDIVLVRMDKIGDLVLSLPVDEHPVFGNQTVHWLVTRGLKFIPDQATPKRSATEFQRGFRPWEFLRLVKWFRTERPQMVILLHSPWWVSCAAWLAGVPQRMGRQSQWHSFLFLNLPVRQRRSLSDRHESDYNFDLVEAGFNRLGVGRASNLPLLKRGYLRLSPPNPYATIEAHGLRSSGYRVVHPGMAGSALNWPAEYFRELIECLVQQIPVVVTGTKRDRKYLAGLKELAQYPDVHWLVDKLSARELLDVLSQARGVVAPSTGVLHLAAALGIPSLGIYSPRKVEHPRRWGPKGLHSGFLVPSVHDQAAELSTPEVMRQISPEQVHRTLLNLELRDNVRSNATSHSFI